MRSDFKKLDSFTSETSKNHLIRNFLRNGRLRVKLKKLWKIFNRLKAIGVAAAFKSKCSKETLVKRFSTFTKRVKIVLRNEFWRLNHSNFWVSIGSIRKWRIEDEERKFICLAFLFTCKMPPRWRKYSWNWAKNRRVWNRSGKNWRIVLWPG